MVYQKQESDIEETNRLFQDRGSEICQAEVLQREQRNVVEEVYRVRKEQS